MVHHFGIQPFRQIGTLSCDSPVAAARVTVAAHVTADRNEGARRDVHSIRTQRDCFYDIGTAAHRSRRDKGNLMTNSFVTQPLIDDRQRQFNRNPHIVAYTSRSRTRSAAETIDDNRVRTRSSRSGCNGGRVVNGCDFHKDRLLVVGGFFQCENQLTQVLN